MTDDIRYETHGHVRLITIDRADKMNSLDFAANDRLIDAWRAFDADDDARVAVVTGAGDKAFCAGADLKTYTMDFATRSGPDYRRSFTNREGIGGITRGMDIFKPILAAVNGFAISGGLELALACDMRFASPNAEFALQDVKWGFHACDGGAGAAALDRRPGQRDGDLPVGRPGRRRALRIVSAWSTDLSPGDAARRHAGLRREAGVARAAGAATGQGGHVARASAARWKMDCASSPARSTTSPSPTTSRKAPTASARNARRSSKANSG